MKIEKVAKTVKFLKEEMEESDIFGVYEDDVKVLLEHCQLLLNSPSLVEDKNNCDCHHYDDGGCGCREQDWNACNEANRVARVKALIGLEDFLSNHKAKGEIVLGAFLTRQEISNLASAVRQHFERG